MRWFLEFLLGAAFWFGVIFYLSEILDIGPGDKPPPLAFGVPFALAMARAMAYFRNPDRNLLGFALCHALAVVAGFSIGLYLFPPEQFQQAFQ